MNKTTLAMAVTSHNFNIANIEIGPLAFSAVHFDVKPQSVLKIKPIDNEDCRSEEQLQLHQEEPSSSSRRRSEAHAKSNLCSFELLSDPANANSQRFKMTILRLSGGEDVRTVPQWRRDLTKVLQGLNLTTPQAKVKVITTIMSGTPPFEAKVQNMASTALEAAILAVAVDSNDAAAQGAGRQPLRVAGLDPHLTDLMVTHSIAHVVQEMMPKKVLARAKREVRRDVREPSDVTIRDYYNHLQRINSLEVHKDSVSRNPIAKAFELWSSEE